nr:glycosyltransferase [Pseudorhodoferax soli]
MLRNADPAGLVWRLCQVLNLPPPGVVAQLRREQADLVHVHFGTDAVAMWPALRHLGLPVLVTLHGYDINTYRSWWEEGQGGWLGRSYPHRLVAMSRHPRVRIVAVSHAVREAAIAYGIAPEKIAVHYIGIDMARFTPQGLPVAKRRPRILFVGRLVEKKGCAHLIDAFARVRQEIPHLELAVIGDGPLAPILRRQAEQLGVPVEFLGSQPAEAVRAQISQARLLCLPSVVAENGDAEGLGLVIVEAQACGVPVVTSARGGATEGIVDGVTGLATVPGNVPGLASALSRILSDPALAERMSAAATGFARERFDLGACTRLLEQEYDDWARIAPVL